MFALAAACGGPPRARAPGADYLCALRIDGNHAITTAALAPALALRESIRDGTAIDPIVLADDTERIRTAYRKRGYFAVTVTPRVDREQHGQVAVFTVVEGRRASTRVDITGVPAELAQAQARALVALADGAPFDYETYDAAKLPLAAWIEDAGYAHAQVHATVTSEAEGALAVASYHIVPGERCTFGAIQLYPKMRPSLDAAVRARLRFATGDRYSVSALERSQADIYEIGRFSSVELVPDRSGDGAVIKVTVELTEANRHEVHVGGGVGYEPETYEGRARGGYSVVPAWQPLLTAAIDARVALTIPRADEAKLQPRLRGLLSLQRLDLFRPRLRGEAELGADYQTVEAYNWTGEHVRFGLGSPLGLRSLQLRAGWMFERLQIDANADAMIDAMSAQQLGLAAQSLGEYQASLVADLRDNPIEPHRGVYLDLRAAAGTPLAGGELTYLQLTPELRGYFSLGGVVLAARARAGAILGDVPVIHRYYSGGTSGQRGFSVRRLSPTVAECSGTGESQVVIGGAGLIETGVELRRQIGTLWTLPIGANVFVDGGDVRCQPEELDPRKLYWAIGGGLWSKLVGDFKIRLDAGYLVPGTGPAVPREHPTVAFHLGIGEAY